MKVKVEFRYLNIRNFHPFSFSGGLELMFENQKTLNVELAEEQVTVERLIDILKKDYLKEKPEMFVAGNSVRPGIIVLINDTDWELLDTTNY
jgi:ubiquitin related modifier 1